MGETNILVSNFSDDPVFPLSTARSAAYDFMEFFKSVEMKNFEIAGSIRREKPYVKDIELVAEPREALDLFGQKTDGTTPFDVQLEGVLRMSRYMQEMGGHRYVRILDRWSGISIDLFIVRPPSQFGCIYTIRTGPGDFSQWLVTQKGKGGAMPAGMWQEKGSLWRNKIEINGITGSHYTEPIPTPTEKDYFAVLGLEWIPPQERRPMWRKP